MNPKDTKVHQPPDTKSRLPVLQFHGDDLYHSVIAFPGTILPLELVAHTPFEMAIKLSSRVIVSYTFDFQVVEEKTGEKIVMPTPSPYAVIGTVIFRQRIKDAVRLQVDVTDRVKLHNVTLEHFFVSNAWEIIKEEPPSPLEFSQAFFQQKIERIRTVVRSIDDGNFGTDVFNPPHLMHGKLTEKTLGLFLDQTAFMFNRFGPLERITKFLRSLIVEPNVVYRLEILTALLEDIRDRQEFMEDFFLDGKKEEGEESNDQEVAVRGKGNSRMNGKKSGEYEKYSQWYGRIRDNVSQEVCDEIERELERMQGDKPPEEAKKHLVFLLKLFSLEETHDNTDLVLAEKILNQDHSGLKKPKERILEHLAVRKYAKGKVNILCFVGPPGVGKTSLGKSIARALGRKYVRLSLGGLRDEAEIKGHGLTYVNTQPGWIIKSIIKSASKNPLFVLDEIDKLSKDSFRGDPQSALLEALDSEQNHAFLDHMINVSFDLSKVFFICTANSLSSIQPALLDRMEVLRISGYTPAEKLKIAKEHLVAKVCEENGFPLPRSGQSPLSVTVSDRAIVQLIDRYTRESGVRQLDKGLGDILRKLVVRFEKGFLRDVEQIEITEENLELYMGKPLFNSEQRFENLPPGCVPMFAVSSIGGHFFYVQVALERGRSERKIKVTGVRASEISNDMTNMIEESVDVAFDGLMLEGGMLHRSPEDREREKDYYIHVHFGDYAVPKDGPSAGIPILWALFGRMQGKSIQPNLGATGEIDLTLGVIGAVGGIREKAIAAHRAGIKRFIIPEDNARDLDEVPEEIKKEIEFLPKRFWWDALLEAFPGDEVILSYIASHRSS